MALENRAPWQLSCRVKRGAGKIISRRNYDYTSMRLTAVSYIRGETEQPTTLKLMKQWGMSDNVDRGGG